MSGKSIRVVMIVVLLALISAVPALTNVVSSPADVVTPVMIMVEEHGTTAS